MDVVVEGRREGGPDGGNNRGGVSEEAHEFCMHCYALK